MECTDKQKQRLEEAAQDTAWAEKLRAAATWADYQSLLAEKGIAAPAELEAAFAAGNGAAELADDALEQVAGGFGPIFPCPRMNDFYLCTLTNCPNKKRDPLFEGFYCTLGFWDERNKDIPGLRPADDHLGPFDPLSYITENMK